MGERIQSHRELNVYQNARASAMEIFELSKSFPSEEKFSLTDQGRRSSRSVCANISEAWRKRRYKAAFIAKLSDAETEACDTQVWLEFANLCGYITEPTFNRLDEEYNRILGQLVRMIEGADDWLIKQTPPHPIPHSPTHHG
ncbi:MAG: four helix bundle protein [Kiritimatiellales bacterium]|nr:four helix bundle protein [Kiritimatiellales bacterium]MCF7863504.1 four helix bundle protein [Kiritimatiellales bacterium]